MTSVTVKKRKHHYIWEHYLSGWAIGGQVWCLRGGKSFLASTENVGHRRDFYRLKEMSAYDVEVVEQLISQMGEAVRETARGWMPHFRLFHQFKRTWEASGRNSPELEDLLDATINDLEEDLHAGIEGGAVPGLAALRAGDASIVNHDKRFSDFGWFIATQYMRTPKMQKSAIEVFGRTIPGFNIEAAWGLLRTIFATNMGGSFFVGRRTLRLVFLEAPAGLEFITGDQPILNTRAVDGAAPTEVELYYPLTPSRAVLMDFNRPVAATEHKALTADEIARYNGMIADASEGQIYARSREALSAIGTGSGAPKEKEA
jgi:hypothetical protein